MKRVSIYYLLLFLHLLGVSAIVQAQSRQPDSMKNKQLVYNQWKKEEKAKQVKAQKQNGPQVVSYDSKGNVVESRYSADGKKLTTTTTTIIIPAALNRKFSVDTINTDSISIKILKGKNRLNVYHKGKLLTAYKCVFGPTHLLQKQCEGDRCTPEGTFTIQSLKDHLKWDKFMLLDYPNKDSWQLFEDNKRNKRISEHAAIGGLIGIHGIWKNGDNVIDLKHNWTDGCISIKNKDVEELAKIVKPGVTKVTILK